MLTVLITNYNTTDFIELSLYALEKLTRNPYKVLINDNGSSFREKERLRQIVSGRDNVKVNWRTTSSKSSRAHGEALDILIPMVDTPYFAILDSDCTFLLKDWDALLLKEINDKVKIIGPVSPVNRSGVRVGSDNFPLPFAVMFETAAYRRLNVSCMPRDIKAGEDTCWQWKGGYAVAGYQSVTFEAFNTRDFKKGPFAALVGVEEYYYHQQLIASHFGRGSSQGLAKYFREAPRNPVFNIFRWLKGVQETRQWINICRKVIADQSGNKKG